MLLKMLSVRVHTQRIDTEKCKEIFIETIEGMFYPVLCRSVYEKKEPI